MTISASLADTTIPVTHPDQTDIDYTNSPDHAQCPSCTHWWPLDDMSRNRSYDLICPDCIYSWSAYPDHR